MQVIRSRGAKTFAKLKELAGSISGRMPMSVICTHHKTGTKWMLDILREVEREFGLRLHDGAQNEIPAGTQLFLQDHSEIDTSRLPYFRGVHIIRDPRDVIVSGCKYHQHSSEAWLHEPQKRFDGRTYQDSINSEAEEDTLIFEMRYSGRNTIKAMASWNYHHPQFLEVKYEDLVQDTELGLFRKIFEHLQLPASQIGKCLQIANRNSLFSGQISRSGHVRDGRVKQWPDHFSERDKKFFKEQFGDVLVKLGYETDNCW